MCGISGLVSRATLNQNDRVVAEQMNNCLSHRGPDGAGWYQADQVHMGMRRLSIIDVAGANQPLYNEDESIVVLFNGEIYNFVELRKELEERGHTFRTHGDGETICHLYEEAGMDGLLKLRGMYAISLYDKKQNLLYLVRDRMSEKPIYYATKDDRFYYASEFKAVTKAYNPEELTLRPEAIDLFLHYQFIPEPMTMVKEVTKVPAGHYAKIHLTTLAIEIKAYWQMLDSAPVTATQEEAAKLVRDELLYISDIIGRSDVPVGIALSGGLDSSTVAALVKHHNSNKDVTNAFTIGYAGRPNYDEREKAQMLSDELGITLHQIELTTADFIQDFPKLVAAMDDPIADIAAYSISRVMQAASEKGIRVMLNGIGADEIFWGYQWIADAVKKTNEQVAAGQTTHLAFYDTNPDFKLLEQKKKWLYPKKFAAQLPADNNSQYAQLGDATQVPAAMIERLSSTWLFSNAVALSDRMSMRHSVELRSPFLDYKLVELAVGLNKTNHELNQQPTKQLLKDAVREFLPSEVVDRPKQGFRPPVEQWFAAVIWKYGRKLYGGYLMRHGVIDRKRLAYLFMATTAPQVFLQYKYILLELWCRVYLEGKSPSEL